jgi:hypothetical protein
MNCLVAAREENGPALGGENGDENTGITELPTKTTADQVAMACNDSESGAFGIGFWKRLLLQD